MAASRCDGVEIPRGQAEIPPSYEFSGGMRLRVEPVDLVDADVVLAGVVPDLNAIVALFDETAPTRTSHKHRQVVAPCDVRPRKASHETRFVPGPEVEKPCASGALGWWAHQGSNLGPAD